MGSRIRRWYSSARSAEFHRLLCCRHKNFSSIDWLTPLCKVKTNWNQIIIEYNESPFDHIAAAVIYFTGVKPDLSSVWKKIHFIHFTIYTYSEFLLYNLQTAEKYRKNFAPILNSHLIDYLNDWIHRFIKPKIFILCQLGMYFAWYLQIVYDKINSDFTSIFCRHIYV